MKARSLQTTIGILLVVAIVVLINLIASTRVARLDLTEEKVYTLAEASRRAVADLQEPMTVKVFASENLSPQLEDVRRYLNDLLADYEAYSNGNFRYEFIDPGTDEALAEEARRYRIPPFQENVWEQDKLELKRVYLGLVILYDGDRETIPTVQTTSGLEYNLTSMIKRLTSQQERTVAFLQGHGEPDPAQAMTQLSEMLRGHYNVTTVNLDDEPVLEADALLIVSPTSEIPERHRAIIDQYIMRGGAVGWFTSQVRADLQTGQANNRGLKINDWTRHYGFQIKHDLVADMNSAQISIQERRGFFTVQNTINYPFFPTVRWLDDTHPVVADLDMLNVFFVSSVDTSQARQAGIAPTVLFTSGEQTMVQTMPYQIDATRPWREVEFGDDPQVLAAAFEGPFPSTLEAGSIPLDDMGNPVVEADALIPRAPAHTRMLVVGDGNFMQDSWLTSASNLFLVLNGVDWLVDDTGLIELRTREMSIRPLMDVPPGEKQAWKVLNWFGPPLLAVAFGIIFWIVRRNRRYGGQHHE